VKSKQNLKFVFMDIQLFSGQLRIRISPIFKLSKALLEKFNYWLGRETVDANRHGEYLFFFF